MPEESPLPFPPAEESPAASVESTIALNSIVEPPFACECNELARTACKDEPFYKEHEGKRYCVLHYPGKEKIDAFKVALTKKLEAKNFNFRGMWFPAGVDFFDHTFQGFIDFEGATFSGAALFAEARFDGSVRFRGAVFHEAASFSRATFKQTVSFYRARFDAPADFGAVQFSADVDYSGATFALDTNFYEATFTAAANFSRTTFSGWATFTSTTFSGLADFSSTKFRALADFGFATFSASADFFSARFRAIADFHMVSFSKDVSFYSAKFYEAVDFRSTTFSGETDFRSAMFNVAADFSYATIKDEMHFSGNQSFREPFALDFQFSSIDRPERLSFHTVILRPHWFVNVDPRKFVFTDVSWNWQAISIDGEIKSLEDPEKALSAPHRLLAIACRQLAENAEANNRYEEASRFRYWAMDLLRPQKWAGWAFWKTDWLHMLYWAVSGYGERIRRAFMWLVGVWLVFALLYTLPNIRTGFDKMMPRKRALTYSLGVMSLQRPEPKALTGTAQTLVTLETILGPLQAALLALAIRRKFMR